RMPDEGRRSDPGAEAPGWTFEGKVDWVARQCARFRTRCAELAQARGAAAVGVIVGRTRLDLRSLALPLPEGFLDRWSLPPLPRADGALAPLSTSLAALLRGALAASAEATYAAVAAIVERLAAGQVGARPGLQRAVHEALRPPVALVEGGGPAWSNGHALCLLPDEALPVGAVVEVGAAPPGGLTFVAADLSASHAALRPAWYRFPGAEPADEAHAPLVQLSPAEIDAVVTLVRSLRAVAIERAVWPAILGWAERLLDAAEAHDVEAPAALARLACTLFYEPDPNRWIIAEAIEALTGVQAPAPPADELTAYIELDLWRAGERPATELARLFDTVEEAIGRARGWLGGAEMSVARLGDTFAVIARRRPPAMSTRVTAELWPQALRFAREVYDACLRRGAPLRVVVDVSSDGLPIVRRGEYLGVAGTGPIEANLVMKHAPHFQRRGAAAQVDGPGHGIAVVRAGAALTESDAALCAWAEDRWREAGGLDGFVRGSGRLGKRAFYHLIWREQAPGALGVLPWTAPTPVDARDDLAGLLCFSARDREAVEALQAGLAAHG
ncbi:MAG: hypothetical protein KC620_25080, partial [Myxococcales bacterium]|nr:hypothetical protein [Myxococcales bacterium]